MVIPWCVHVYCVRTQTTLKPKQSVHVTKVNNVLRRYVLAYRGTVVANIECPIALTRARLLRTGASSSYTTNRCGLLSASSSQDVKIII